MQPGFWEALAIFAGLSSLWVLTKHAGAQEVAPDGTLEAEASGVLPATPAADSENAAIQPIVEAQGWRIGENGKVMLVAEASAADPAVMNPIPCP